VAGSAVRVQAPAWRSTRLLPVSISMIFAVLLIAGVIAMGVAALILLILLLVRSTAQSRS
jgi:hypothetical protein